MKSKLDWTGFFPCAHLFFSFSKDPTCEKARIGLQCGQCTELPRGPLDLFKDSEGVVLHADEEMDVSLLLKRC